MWHARASNSSYALVAHPTTHHNNHRAKETAWNGTMRSTFGQLYNLYPYAYVNSAKCYARKQDKSRSACAWNFNITVLYFLYLADTLARCNFRLFQFVLHKVFKTFPRYKLTHKQFGTCWHPVIFQPPTPCLFYLCILIFPFVLSYSFPRILSDF